MEGSTLEQPIKTQTLYPDMFARRLAEPFVADALYRIGEHFGCDPNWTSHRLDAGSKLVKAEPLPANSRQDFGYGRRTGPDIHVSVTADMAHSEHTWSLGALDLLQGSRRGSISLKTYVTARFTVDRSIGYDIRTGDDIRYGIVCWAPTYELPNGSHCVRLRTFAGDVWLQPNPGSSFPRLSYVINENQLQPHGENLYHVTLTSHADKGKFEPWRGLESLAKVDDRAWSVDKSELFVNCSITDDKTLHSARRRLQQQASKAIVLEPPYEAVWIPRVLPDSNPLSIQLLLEC